MGELRFELDEDSAFTGHVVVVSSNAFRLKDIFVQLKDETLGRDFDRLSIAPPAAELAAGKYYIPFTYLVPTDCRGDLYRHFLSVQIFADAGYGGPLKADVEVPVGRAAMRLPPHVAWTDTGAHVGSALSVELTSSEAVRGHDVSGHIIVENPTVFSLREFRIHMRSYNEHYFSNYFEAVVVAAPHHPLQSGKYVVSFQYPLPDTCRTDCVHVLEVSMCVQSGYCGNLSASVPITVSRP